MTLPVDRLRLSRTCRPLVHRWVGLEDRAAKKRRRKRRKKTAPAWRVSEYQEQVTLFQWASAMAQTTHPELDSLFAVPNGVRTSIGLARKLVASGLKKGVPDLFLPVARRGAHGLFIELKAAVRPAPVSIDQQRWSTLLSNEGYWHYVCRGWEEARDVLLLYLTEAKRS